MFTSATIPVAGRGIYGFLTGGLELTPGVLYAVAIQMTAGNGAVDSLYYTSAPGPLPGASFFAFGLATPSTPTGVAEDLAVRIVTNPEPSTIALVGLGVLGLGALARRRRRART